MKNNKNTKIENKNFFQRQRFVSALLIGFVITLAYLAVNNFMWLSGNDDYVISKLINNGELGISVLGIFFTWFISVIQPLFGVLNAYFITMAIVSFLSLSAISYVFLSKLNPKTGWLMSIVLGLMYYTFITIEIRFSFTSIVACTAGFVLMVYASQFEERKRFRIVQLIGGFLILFTGSQVRFDPVLAMFATAAVMIFCVLLSNILKQKKNSDFKTAFKTVFKKYIKTGIIIVLTAIIIFSLNTVSIALKSTVDGYDEMSAYNHALSSVVDYRTVPYYGNETFFNSMDIHSASNINLLKKWFVDDEFFTLEKLTAISEFCRDQVNKGIYKKSIISYVLDPIQKAFTQKAENGTIWIYLISAIVVLIAAAVLAILLKKQRAVVIKLALLIIIWLFYLLTTSGFNPYNILTLPLIFITFYIAVRYNNYQYIGTVALTLTMIAMYEYIVTRRCWFHTELAVIFPATVMMIFALNNDNLIGFEPKSEQTVQLAKNKKKKVKKNISKKNKSSNTKAKVLPTIISIIMIATSAYAGAFTFSDQVYIKPSTSNAQLREYVENHPENTFVINQTFLFKHYYEPFILPKEKQNVANFGLWVTKSKYMKNTFARNGIKHIFRDAINDTKIRLVLYDTTENGQTVVSGASTLKEYYNEHYAKPGEKIDIVKSENVGSYAICKVVSQKTQ